MTATQAPINVAPGSVVVVRDEEWVVQETEETADGLLIRARGLGELVRDTTASFYASLDTHRTARSGQDATGVADTARTTAPPGCGWRARSAARRPCRCRPEPDGRPRQMLADPLVYQQTAVRKALDPANLRPRILLADAVGLGKTLEIGMILSELVRRGRGDRILIVTPKHVLEQMQQEMWARFALPFVRLDSAGIQRVRQKLPATRNPFTFYKRR